MSSIAINPHTVPVATRTVACPSCQKKYGVPSTFVGAAQCRKCGNQILIKTLNAGIESAVPDQRMRKAGFGLVACSVGGILLGLVVVLAVFFGNPIDRYSPGSAAILFGIGAGISALILLGGLALQFTVPPEAKSKRWLVASIAISLASSSAIALAIATGTSNLLGNWLAQSVVLFLSTTSFVFYINFLSKTSRFSGRDDISATARGLTIYQLLVPTVFAVLAIAAPHLLASTKELQLICGMINALGGIANLITNIVIVTLMMQLGSHLLRKQQATFTY